MANEPIFIVFKEQKIRALTANDEFFKKVAADKEAYFKNLDYIETYLQGKSYDPLVIADMMKYLSILFIAQEQGYMDIQWNRLFAIKKADNFREIVTSRYEFVKRTLPHITEAWDKHILEIHNKKGAKKTTEFTKE